MCGFSDRLACEYCGTPHWLSLREADGITHVAGARCRRAPGRNAVALSLLPGDNAPP